MQITIMVNGEKRQVVVGARTRLLDLLRDDLHLTGAKEGCGKGECGACTVIMNGELAASCLVLAPQADGAEIITIEGLSQGKWLDPLQESFIEAGAVQCGFCTPGMILAGKVLLDNNPDPDEEEIRRGLSGNICRCTGYQKIINAVKLAAGKRGKEWPIKEGVNREGDSRESGNRDRDSESAGGRERDMNADLETNMELETDIETERETEIVAETETEKNGRGEGGVI